jgi:hypothetical protein
MRQTLSDSTRQIYTQHVRDYLKPRLGAVPLSELTVGEVQAMFTSLVRLNATRSRPLSSATLQPALTSADGHTAGLSPGVGGHTTRGANAHSC